MNRLDGEANINVQGGACSGRTKTPRYYRAHRPISSCIRSTTSSSEDQEGALQLSGTSGCYRKPQGRDLIIRGGVAAAPSSPHSSTTSASTPSLSFSSSPSSELKPPSELQSLIDDAPSSSSWPSPAVPARSSGLAYRCTYSLTFLL